MSSVTTTETKAAKVQSLLKRKHGASIDDICIATSWKPHSVRAFLTGLRKKGHTIVQESDGAGVSRYRIPQEKAQPKQVIVT